MITDNNLPLLVCWNSLRGGPRGEHLVIHIYYLLSLYNYRLSSRDLFDIWFILLGSGVYQHDITSDWPQLSR